MVWKSLTGTAVVDIRAVLRQRQIRIVDRRVLVVLALQMRGLGPDVAEPNQRIADDFPLQRQAPVLGVGRDEFLIQHDHEQRRGKRHVVVGGADREDIHLLASLKRLIERTIVILHVIAERRDIVGVVLRVERRARHRKSHSRRECWSCRP